MSVPNIFHSFIHSSIYYNTSTVYDSLNPWYLLGKRMMTGLRENSQ